MLFSNGDAYMVKFLSTSPETLRSGMNPILLKHLQLSHVEVGDDLSDLQGDGFWDILAGLTGVKRTKEEALAIMGASFCLTGDSLLKILAIVYRAKCKVPVVLLGECGCGKTMLLSFMCRWMGVALLTLDVHGGTSEEDIVDIFRQADASLRSSDKHTVFVFLDEVNTCSHMGLINEAVCHRSLNGHPINNGIQILAALNPYRLRPDREGAGLTANAMAATSTNAIPTSTSGVISRAPLGGGLTGGNKVEATAADPLSKLVYRVHPIPPTLRDFIFDFGALQPETELLYIQVRCNE
jgi:hypothetical protein